MDPILLYLARFTLSAYNTIGGLFGHCCISLRLNFQRTTLLTKTPALVVPSLEQFFYLLLNPLAICVILPAAYPKNC